VETVAAVTLKLAEVAAAGTATEGGTVKAVLFELRPTTTPPAGAALESVTVQLAMEQFRAEIRTGATRPIVAVREEPLSEAVTVAV